MVCQLLQAHHNLSINMLILFCNHVVESSAAIARLSSLQKAHQEQVAFENNPKKGKKIQTECLAQSKGSILGPPAPQEFHSFRLAVICEANHIQACVDSNFRNICPGKHGHGTGTPQVWSPRCYAGCWLLKQERCPGCWVPRLPATQRRKTWLQGWPTSPEQVTST